MSDIVYHFCSMETFLKIVTEKKLKFSDIKKSNDGKEIDYLWDEYLKLHENDIWMRFSKPQQNEYVDCLAACFSKTKSTLHMWTSYANEGVAIGFSEKELIDWSEKIEYIQNKFVYNVEANQPEDKTWLVKHGDVNYLKRGDVPAYIEKIKKKTSDKDLSIKFMQESPFIKMHYWQEEKEWRIVFFAYHNEEIVNIEETVKRHSVPLMYEMNSKHGARAYALLDFESSMIKEIILAPNCVVSEEGIKKILITQGIDIQKIQVLRAQGSMR